MFRFQTFVLVLFSTTAFAFIPPIEESMQKIFTGRASGKDIEYVLRHRVYLPSATPAAAYAPVVEGAPVAEVQAPLEQSIEITEKIVWDGRKASFTWYSPETSDVTGILETQGYRLPNKTIPTRSGVFLRYFIASQGAELIDRLILENFLQKEQLLQFDPSFNPEGDPKTWKTNDFYIKHENIFITRLKSRIVYAVIGFEDSGIKRSFYMDRDLQGIRRFEWVDGSETGPVKAAWDFEQFQNFGNQGVFPRTMSLEVNEKMKVSSELLQVRPAQEKPQKNTRDIASVRGPSVAFDEALRVLLSYR